MTDGFSRTLQTADQAEGVARLLDRAADRAASVHLHSDAGRLRHLAERYTDYAAALRQTAADAGSAAPEPEQGAML